jgi:hypothetical protein
LAIQVLANDMETFHVIFNRYINWSNDNSHNNYVITRYKPTMFI